MKRGKFAGKPRHNRTDRSPGRATLPRETPYARPPVRPSPLINRDFATLPEVVEHARQVDGATHVVVGPETLLYFPVPGGGGYAEAAVWHERGYWHAAGPQDRRIVRRLPKDAERITATMWRAGRGAAEASGRHGQRAASPVVPSPLINRAAPRGGSRRAPTRVKRVPMTKDGVMRLAGELSKATDGSEPKYLQGGYRWSGRNQSAVFTTYSPEHQQTVVVVVSVFEDGSVALDFFSDERLSESHRYENIGHFLYGPGGFTSREVDVTKMTRDIEWVWKTVDGYAESWQQDGDDLYEARRRPASRRPPAAGRVRDYVPLDPRGKPLGRPTPDYSAAKRDADKAGGYVKYHQAGERSRRPPPRAQAARRRAR